MSNGDGDGNDHTETVTNSNIRTQCTIQINAHLFVNVIQYFVH